MSEVTKLDALIDQLGALAKANDRAYRKMLKRLEAERCTCFAAYARAALASEPRK